VQGYDPMTSFGEDTAEIYDDESRGDEAEAVAFLAEVANGGPALELAIGTGRVALPLAETGIRVDGIDLSEPMVARLRAKPGGADLDVTIGDFADVPVDRMYRLIYVVYNTFFNLLTQDEEVRCFENVATHLERDGVFVIETMVPSWLYGLRDGQHVDAEDIQVDEVWLDVAKHDAVGQRLLETHVRLRSDGIALFPIVQRYAWPAEMDLMARIAGLRLLDRWGGWNREPFTAASRLHVSVYGR
jgi:SAM-dependent methyltransferase